MTPEEIRELPDDVRFGNFAAEGFDPEALADKLEAASFADLVAIVESLGL
jgi:hypothetical protein